MSTDVFIDRENEPAPLADELYDSATGQPRDPDGKYAARESNEETPESQDESEAAETEETPEVEASADDTAESTEESNDAEPEAAPKRDGIQRMQERIGQLTAQKRAAEAQAAALQAQLQQYQPPEPVPPVDPDLEFDDPAAFHQNAVRTVLQEQQAAQAEAQLEAAAQQAEYARLAAIDSSRQMFMTRLEASRSEMPDFDHVFPQIPVSETAVEFLGDSELGPQVAYHLAKNASEAARIDRLPPLKQVAELARIEARLQTAPARRLTKAPPPPKKVGGGSNPQRRDPTKMSMDEYRKFREGA